MKVIYFDHLSKDTFADFDEGQNKALYSIKMLLSKLNKEYPGVLKQKPISVEQIRDKGI